MAKVEVFEPILPPRLGELLLMLRKRKGWSLKNLEAASGISESTLSRYERGLREPTIGALRRIAAALEVDPGVLVSATPSKRGGKARRPSTYTQPPLVAVAGVRPR